jgi:hypothetical protein
MELEDLKTIWRVGMEGTLIRDRDEQKDQQTRYRQGDQTGRQIRALLGKRSRGLVARMKRNLFGELLLVLAIYIPTILFYLFEFIGKDAATGWALLLLLICFAGYYYRKNKLLNAMQCPACAIRANLERQAVTLQKYIRFYTIAGTILVPVMAVLSFLSGSHLLFHPSTGSLPYFLSGPDRWKDLWLCAAALISVTVLSYITNVWAMNKLYGRHIKKLRLLLQEMDEE